MKLVKKSTRSMRRRFASEEGLNEEALIDMNMALVNGTRDSLEALLQTFESDMQEAHSYMGSLTDNESMEQGYHMLSAAKDVKNLLMEAQRKLDNLTFNY